MKRAKRLLALLIGLAMLLSLLGAVAEQEVPAERPAEEAPLESAEEAPAENPEEEIPPEAEQEPAEAPEPSPDGEDAGAAEAGEPGFVMDGDTLVVYEGPGGDVVVPNGVKVIGPMAFCQLPELRSVEIPGSVERIESYAFADCENLERVALREGLLVIADHAFQNCSGLREIALPEGLASIGDEAFRGCEALGELYVPESVSSIGAFALPESEAAEEAGDAGDEAQSAKEAGEAWPVVAEEALRIVNPIEALGVKESYALQVAPEGEGYVWTSDNEKFVKIVDPATGEIQGVKKGSATVTVAAADGRTASIVINVLPAPGKISLSAKKGILGVNEQVQLTARLPKNTASQHITWTSGKPDIVKVENGLVTALAPGKAKITVQTFNKKKASYSVEIKEEPKELPVPEALALSVGQKYTLTLQPTPAKAAGRLKISNSNESALKLDKTDFTMNGKASIKLTAKAEGSATLRFELYNGLVWECAVKVCAPPTELRIVNAVANLGVKEEYQLRAENDSDPGLMAHAKWKSSNKKVIAVDAATGKLTAKKKGSAKITVTLPKGKKTIKKTISIKVIAPASGIELSQTSAEMNEGDTLQLTATVPSKTASQIHWSSSDDGIASVEDGLVTAVSGGEAVITARTFNGYEASCAVTVIGSSAPRIAINGVAAGSRTQKVYDNVALTWSCDDPVKNYNIEIVDEEGQAIVSREGILETSEIIPKEQLVPGVVYSVTVSAIRDVNGESKISSRTARFVYLDPNADFEYQSNGEGITITKYKGNSAEVEVPSQLDGMRVTRIATEAFNGDNCASVTSIIWPEGVVFEENSVAGLKGCADANGFLVFDGTLCEYFGKAASITIPADITRINDGAFDGNGSITSVKIPNTVREIGARAFANCGKLASMVNY